MTKSKIFAGAGIAALGAVILPAAVFAADGDLTQTDTVKVTVDSACSLATSGSSLSPASTYEATIANGAYNTNIAGSTFTITCNDTGGWDLNAIGAGTATGDVTKMDASTNKDADDIATGTTLDGSVSNWAFKVAAGGSTAPTIVTGYTDFSAVPSGSTKIANGVSTKGNSTVTATYGVGISATQSAGVYTGKVSYTLAHPAATGN